MKLGKRRDTILSYGGIKWIALEAAVRHHSTLQRSADMAYENKESSFVTLITKLQLHCSPTLPFQNLYPNKHLWDIVYHTVASTAGTSHPPVQEQTNALIQVWEGSPPETNYGLIWIMVRRCREYTQTCGGCTDYWATTWDVLRKSTLGGTTHHRNILWIWVWFWIQSFCFLLITLRLFFLKELYTVNYRITCWYCVKYYQYFVIIIIIKPVLFH